MGLRHPTIKTYICKTCLGEKKREKFPKEHTNKCRECLRTGRRNAW